jgi:hypothetical protein
MTQQEHNRQIVQRMIDSASTISFLSQADFFSQPAIHDDIPVHPGNTRRGAPCDSAHLLVDADWNTVRCWSSEAGATLMRGFPPTGQRIRSLNIHLFRIVDGHVVDNGPARSPRPTTR